MSLPSHQTSSEEPALTLASALAVLGRRRAFLLWSLLLILAAAVVSCVLATPRYRATAEIQVQKEDGGALGLENTVTGQSGAGAATDSLDYNMTLQTDATILRSPALAVNVIEATHLENTSDYFGQAKTGFPMPWKGLLKNLPWRKPLEPLSIPLAEAPNRRYAAERIFAAHFKAQPLAGTRLIDISYTDPDPVRAALVANTATRVLSDLSFQQRFTATFQGSSWLSGQLEDLRAHAERAQARAAALQRGTGVFGSDGSRNVVLERLESLNQTLTAAESNRILKQSIDKVAASGSPELISSLSGNSSTGSVASINSSLSLIQGLRQQEAQVRAQLAESKIRYGSAYPQVAELQAELTGVENSITAETARLGQRAHTDWQIAVREENAARAAFEEQKILATRQTGAVNAYQLAREEADGSRDLYEGLLTKLKQASVLEGMRANNISVVSRATPPPPNYPSNPNIPLRLGAAFAAGLVIGLVAAFVAEWKDQTIHSPATIESIAGAPLLAVLPSVDRLALGVNGKARGPIAPAALRLPPNQSPIPLPVLHAEFSPFSEALRSLRTSLQLAGCSGFPKVILVTSCLPNEGKTTVALNLAALLAMGGSRALLVDADLRRPTLHFYSKNPQPQGLAMALSGPQNVAPHEPIRSFPNLQMLSGWEVPHLPSELLGSPRLPELLEQWKADHDVVVLDSPPLLPVTDAVLLAQHADVTLLVARHKQTTERALRCGLQALQQGPTPRAPIGLVFNGVAAKSADFNAYFGYEGGHYAPQGA